MSKNYQLSLFEDQRLSLQRSIELTTEYLKDYFSQYKRVAIAFSGGKDSSALVSLVCHLIDTGKVPVPESLTVIYANTRMELPPLQASAMAMLEEVRRRGFETRVACAPLDKRFLVYILGRGVPPPSNTFRWCTGSIKVEPMLLELGSLAVSSEPLLMLTGVRIGESAVRDQRISISCSKNGAECGQGWFQSSTSEGVDTLAPLLHWRVCHIWEWLIMGELEHGFPTLMVAHAYGGDEAQEANARTGCIGCPLTEKDTALDLILKEPEWAYLSPLKRLKPIYREMRNFANRLQKDGTETRKDGSLVANPGRKGPLTLEAREQFLEEILLIQREINFQAQGLGRPITSLINAQEEARIRELIETRTFPNKWSGDEPNGADLLPDVYSDGTVQPLLWEVVS